MIRKEKRKASELMASGPIAGLLLLLSVTQPGRELQLSIDVKFSQPP
jgi:hypothetical protein